jgi:hypothetical protein
MVDTALAEDKYTVTMPDFEDSEAITVLLAELHLHEDIFGVKKLINSVEKATTHADLAERFKEQAYKTASRINGIRSYAQKKGDKVRSLRHTAQRFYEALSTQGLRQHCALFGIDYDSYDNQEDIIAAVIQKHIDMDQAG